MLPFGLERKVEDDLFQMMAGACRTLHAAGCVLVGGHTCEGTELALGFAVNGSRSLTSASSSLHKGIKMKKGANPMTTNQSSKTSTPMNHATTKHSMCLVLTKAVGTGTIFAADMRVQAKANWVSSALKSMCTSNEPAADIFTKFGSIACTDVTGFGVLGHLIEMLKASCRDHDSQGSDNKNNNNDSQESNHNSILQCNVNLDDVPTLPGALECIHELQIFSSLQPANLRLKRAIENEAVALSHEKYPLLFDPQTAGGLLAILPAENGQPCVNELKKVYPDATIIGTLQWVFDGDGGSSHQQPFRLFLDRVIREAKKHYR